MDDVASQAREARPLLAVRLQGACAINRGDDIGCTMVGLSAERGAVLSAATAAMADEVIFSLPHIGILKASVARVFEGGFDVLFAPNEDSKLAIYLSWLAGDDEGQPKHDLRKHERIVPIRRLVELTAGDEPARMVRLVDISRSGAAFTSSSVFAVGDAVTLGVHPAAIVRLFEGGAAAHFDETLPEEGFGPLVDLAASAEVGAAGGDQIVA